MTHQHTLLLPFYRPLSGTIVEWRGVGAMFMYEFSKLQFIQ